jgi:hypothetical protein
MWLLDKLAEARIGEAMEAGAFDDLPGQGQPLQLEDDTLVPEHLRVGYRLLKNAGYLSPDMQLRGEIADVNALLHTAQREEERTHLARRLRYLLMKLSHSRGGQTMGLDQAYYQQLVQHFDPD